MKISLLLLAATLALVGCEGKPQIIAAAHQARLNAFADRIRALPTLTQRDRFPFDAQEALAAVSKHLTQKGDSPADFHAELHMNEKAQVLEFTLWNKRVYSEGVVRVVGGAGGSRTVLYGLEDRSVKTIHWQ